MAEIREPKDARSSGNQKAREGQFSQKSVVNRPKPPENFRPTPTSMVAKPAEADKND